MVSTRRMARKESIADLAETEEMDKLRQKPVRKGTKKTELKPETLKPKMKRNRKAAAIPAEDHNIVGPGLEEQEKLSLDVKPTKRGSRQKKNVVTAPAGDDSAIRQPPKATRSTTSGVKKNEITMGERSMLTVATDSKNTRQTRATTAKPPPLSPKKITQVTNPTTYVAKVAGMKFNVVGNAPKTRTRRTRTTSDENADMIATRSTTGCNDEDILADSSTSKKKLSSFKEPAKRANAAQSEASMSSHPTTPSDSPTSNFDRITDEHEYPHRGNTFSDSDIEGEEDNQTNEESEDELCGPKTPMKRSSPGAETRYLASVHRTTIENMTKKYMKSHSSQSMPYYCQDLDMPQKQNFSDKAAVPQSETVPMTVVRGTDDLCDQRNLHSPGFGIEDISLDTTECNASIAVNMTTHVEESEVMLFDALVDDDDEFRKVINPGETIKINQTSAEELAFDLNSVNAAHDSFESEDTVIFTETDNASVTNAYGKDVVAVSPGASVVPETLVWENIKQDAPIPINFEKHFSTIGSPSLTTTLQDTVTADAKRTSNLAPFSHPDSEGYHPATRTGLTVVSGSSSLPVSCEGLESADRDTTVNFNDFIDVSALTEQPQTPHDPQPPLAHHVEASKVMADFQKIQSPYQPEKQYGRQQTKNAAINAFPIDRLNVPHYALTTVAFDARRKSLPAFNSQTPIKMRVRPHTSDGGSMLRTANPFTEAWWSRSRSNHGTPITRTTLSHQPVEAEQANVLTDTVLQKCEAHTLQSRIPGERYPRFKQTYKEHAKTVTVPTRFQTPQKASTTCPMSAQNLRATTVTPLASLLRPRSVTGRNKTASTGVKTPQDTGELPSAPLTPQETPCERCPRRVSRSNYEKHANTMAAPARFKTPNQASVKRPGTVQKHGSLRKVSFNVNMTPGYTPMTPHPAAPLRGVLALVEIFTLEGASASAPFVTLLHRLGAKTTRVWSDHLTHVIFKDGSPTTLQRVRTHNRKAEENGNAPLIYCVNSRWVSDCDTEGRRVDERDEEYAVDTDEIPRGGRRRRKSMEPSALVNLGGNIVRDRTSSWGRNSAIRSPIKLHSPAAEAEDVESMSKAVPEDEQENSTDELSSPATPAYLAAPNMLIQQTAPVHRMWKLGQMAQDRARNRRLTFFPSQT
ncbi:hypothetical protein M433DRAFT_173979 [Acidomyces richmondensis BFW]|nr:MAG: hypothetical protein FE78DRAFT_34505 [Acidomyces sp. 'richmondensis']KYG45993.1 hypothetical protein M433DRAFT_173979 [Acidomyces richmondensis BFW]